MNRWQFINILHDILWIASSLTTYQFKEPRLQQKFMFEIQTLPGISYNQLLELSTVQCTVSVRFSTVEYWQYRQQDCCYVMGTDPEVFCQYHDDLSNGNIFRVTGPLCREFTGPGEFPAQRPVTRSFDVFFDMRPNKRLSKQPWGWWFETPSWSYIMTSMWWQEWYRSARTVSILVLYKKLIPSVDKQTVLKLDCQTS